MSTAESLEVTPEGKRHRPSAKLLLNVGGWLLFGVAMVIGSLDVMPWDVVLAMQPVYVLFGFLPHQSLSDLTPTEFASKIQTESNSSQDRDDP